MSLANIPSVMQCKPETLSFSLECRQLFQTFGSYQIRSIHQYKQSRGIAVINFSL